MVETIDITNVFTSNFEIILGKLLGEELEGFLKALYSIEPKIDTSRVVNFLLLEFFFTCLALLLVFLTNFLGIPLFQVGLFFL